MISLIIVKTFFSDLLFLFSNIHQFFFSIFKLFFVSLDLLVIFNNISEPMLLWYRESHLNIVFIIFWWFKQISHILLSRNKFWLVYIYWVAARQLSWNQHHLWMLILLAEWVFNQAFHCQDSFFKVQSVFWLMKVLNSKNSTLV